MSQLLVNDPMMQVGSDAHTRHFVRKGRQEAINIYLSKTSSIAGPSPPSSGRAGIQDDSGVSPYGAGNLSVTALTPMQGKKHTG